MKCKAVSQKNSRELTALGQKTTQFTHTPGAVSSRLLRHCSPDSQRPRDFLADFGRELHNRVWIGGGPLSSGRRSPTENPQRDQDYGRILRPVSPLARHPRRAAPPNHYRLLGVAIYESDPEVLLNAADRQMSHVRTFQSGKHSDESQKLLNEIATAKVCLLNAEKKTVYDSQLRTAEEPPQAILVAPPPPPPPLELAEPPIVAHAGVAGLAPRVAAAVWGDAVRPADGAKQFARPLSHRTVCGADGLAAWAGCFANVAGPAQGEGVG